MLVALRVEPYAVQLRTRRVAGQTTPAVCLVAGVFRTPCLSDCSGAQLIISMPRSPPFRRIHMPPILQICLGFFVLAVTLGIHLVVVNVSLTRVSARFEEVRFQSGPVSKTTLVLSYILFLSIALLFEAMIWALVFIALDVVTGFWQAVYFAIVTLTTLGYGDLVPPEGAQLVAAFCAITGLFLVGLSTAFVIELLRRIEAPT